MAKETTLWGIHGGRTGDADLYFLKKNVVAIGWHKVGDLAKLQANREAFRDAVAAAYPGKKPGSVPVNAGQLFRFAHEMSVGDLIAYPSRADRHIHIGRIEGPYQYDPKTEPTYPQTRPVKWLASLPRTKFTQGALRDWLRTELLSDKKLCPRIPRGGRGQSGRTARDARRKRRRCFGRDCRIDS